MSAGSDRAVDKAAFRELLERWASAVRAKDLDGILAHHAADIVVFDVPPPLAVKGIDAYRKTWDPFVAWSDDPVVFDIEDMEITAGRPVDGHTRTSFDSRSVNRCGIRVVRM
jgi:ketosteroid isomerase-like protein